MSCHACARVLGDDEEVIEVACTYVYCQTCTEVTTPKMKQVLDECIQDALW